MLTVCDKTKVLMTKEEMTYGNFIQALKMFRDLDEENLDGFIWVDSDRMNFMFRNFSRDRGMFDTQAIIEVYDGGEQKNEYYDGLAQMWYDKIEKNGYECLIIGRL